MGGLKSVLSMTVRRRATAAVWCAGPRPNPHGRQRSPDEGGQMTQALPTVRVRARPAVLAGLGAGVLGAAVMAMFAMIASATYHGTGFFTPMYHIAASILSPDTMMASATAAQAGNPFHFVAA